MEGFIGSIDVVDTDELRRVRSLINEEISRRPAEDGPGDEADSYVSVCDFAGCPCMFKLPYGVYKEDVKRSDLTFQPNQIVIYNLDKDDHPTKTRKSIIRLLNGNNADIRVLEKKGIAFLKFHTHQQAALAQAKLLPTYRVNFSVTPETMKFLQKK